jgi:SAM-dependent methyltransferase
MWAETAETRRLHWGCGGSAAPGWINSDRGEYPGVDLVCDIRDGLPLPGESIEYAVSIHALPEIAYDDLVPALAELRRVLKPGGVLRLGLPDLEKGVDAYRRGDRDYFALVPDEDAQTIGAKLVTQLVWYGYVRTLFVRDFVEEALRKAGFREVHHVGYRETRSSYPDIVELDNREAESLFVEAVK